MTFKEFDYFQNQNEFPRIEIKKVLDTYIKDFHYVGGIDQDLLIKDILQASEGNGILKNFDFKKYVGKIETKTLILGEEEFEYTYSFHQKTGINTKNKIKEDDINTFKSKKINTHKNRNVSTEPSFRIAINLQRSQVSCILDFSFVKNTIELEGDTYININSTNYSDGTTISTETKILAIELETYQLGSFIKLANQLNVNVESYILYKFKKVHNSILSSELEKLNNFYKIAPIDFLASLSLSSLFIDFELLLKYDKKKWFVDNSDSMIKVLGLIASKESGMKFLYTKFNSNPELIKEIYYYLDGEGNSAYHNNELIPNKTIFASILSQICNQRGKEIDKKRLRTDHIFKITKGYRIDSNVGRDDKFEDKYNLTQEVNKTKVVTENLGGTMDGSASRQYFTYEKDLGWFKEGETNYFHPLDMVTLIVDGPKGKLSLIIPAIMAKDLAYHQEWEEIEKAIRIGMDIFIIVVSIATLVSGPGVLLTVLSIADLGLATTDLAIQVFEDEIRKLDGGADFLDTWETVYLIGGFITGAALLPSLLKLGGKVLAHSYRGGAKLLAQATAVEVRQQLISMLKAALKEAPNFPKFIKGQFEIITDYTKVLGVKFSVKMQKLADEGMFLIKGITENNLSEYLLFYKNEVISIGNVKKLMNNISEIFRLKGTQLLDKISEFVLLLKRQKTMVNTSAKIGEESTKDSLKWGTVKMKLHPKYKEFLKFLKDRNIKIIEIEDIAMDVGYTERMIFDKTGKNLLRVEKQLEVHPDMRFLDLEHEIDHIIQFEKNLKGKFCTDMKKDIGLNRPLKDYKNGKMGWTDELKKVFLELEERIKELKRLKERKVPEDLIKEHIGDSNSGYLLYKKQFEKLRRNLRSSKRREFDSWRQEYFPNFKEIDVSNF